MEQDDAMPLNPPPGATVWPPPPTTAPPVGYGRPIFLSGQGLAQVIIPLLVVGIVFDVVETVMLGSHSVSVRAYAGAVSVVDTLISLVMGVFFLVWTYRSYRNLQALGTQGLRWSPGWAVGYFFIPILSLYRPYQVFREIWLGSAAAPELRTSREWQRAKAPGLLLAWWLSYMAANVLSSLSSFGGTSNFGIVILIEVPTALSAVLAILIVRRITARQDAAALALAGASV